MKTLNLIAIFAFIFSSVTTVSAQSKEDKKTFDQAKKLFENENYAEALPHFKSLTEKEPGNISYYYRLGACLAMTENEPAIAVKHLKQTLSEQPEFAEAHVFLMKAYLLMDNYEEANNHYEKFLEAEDEQAISKRIDFANELLNQYHLAMEKKQQELELAQAKERERAAAEAERKEAERKAAEAAVLAANAVKETARTADQTVKTTAQTGGQAAKTPEKAEAKAVSITTLSVKNINCDFASASIKAELFPELKELITLMKEHKEIKIELTGHTDSKGTDSYNMMLGQRRAKALAAHLQQAGISASRISVKSMGESAPLAPNENPDGSDNPEGREKNRRVEIKIMNAPASLTVKYEN
jgi:outer membrane protein OmpA-like peptidoglycan-associated protein